MAGFGDFRKTEEEQKKKEKKQTAKNSNASKDTKTEYRHRRDNKGSSKSAKKTAKATKKNQVEYRHKGSRSTDPAKEALKSFLTIKPANRRDTSRPTSAAKSTLGVFGKVDASPSAMISLSDSAAKKKADSRLNNLTDQNMNRLGVLANPAVTEATQKDVKKAAAEKATQEILESVSEATKRRKEKARANVLVSSPAISVVNRERDIVSGLDRMTGHRINALSSAKEHLTDYANDVNRQLYRDIGDDKSLKVASNISQMGTNLVLDLASMWYMPGAKLASTGSKAARAAAALGRIGTQPTTYARGTRYFGQGYDEALAEGATEEEATKAAGISAAGSTLLESLGGGERALNAVLGGKVGGNLLKNALKSAGSETIEENIQNIWNSISKLGYKDYDKIASAKKGESAIISLPEILETSPYAAAMGLLGGGSVNAAVNSSAPSVSAGSGQKRTEIPNVSEMVRAAQTQKAKEAEMNMVVPQSQVDSYVDKAYAFGQDPSLPKQKSYLEVAKPTERLINDLAGEFDVSGYTHALRDNDIRHIRNSHGELTNEKYPVTKQDIKRIPDIIANYDDVLFIPDEKGRTGILYVKQHNGVTYYLEQATGRYGNKSLLINKQMIKVPTGTIPDIKSIKDAINKKWNIPSSPDDTSIPRVYVQAAKDEDIPFNDIIPDGSENSNPLYETGTRKSTASDTHDNSDDTFVSPEYTPNVSENSASTNIIPNNSEDGNPSIFDDYTKDMEQIKQEYANAVDTELLNFVQENQGNNSGKNKFFTIGAVNERKRRDIQNLTGIDTDGYVIKIDSSAINHISKRHGAAGKHDSTMSDPGDIARIGYVLNNYDTITAEGTTSRYQNADGTASNVIAVEKRINGNYIVIEAVPQSKKQNLLIISAYKKKADQSVHDAGTAPSGNVQNAPTESAYTNIIPDNAENSNGVTEEEISKIARVSAETPKEKKSLRQIAQEFQDVFQRELVNTGYAIDRLANTTGNQNIKYRYNNVGQASRTIESMVTQNQSDIDGRNIGKSVSEIFEKYRDSDAYYNNFQEYLFHKHNIDRMREGKPVFGESVTALDSEVRAKELLEKYPEFQKDAEEVYNYNRGLMQWRVDSGLISKEQAEELLKKYPYYVGTYRQMPGRGGLRSNGAGLEVDSTIDRAIGSDMDLVPLHEQMVNQTAAVVYNARINKFLNELYDTLPQNQKAAVTEASDYDVDTEAADNIPFKVDGNKVTFYRNGNK
ncbi:MAG: hypothetical protein Q4C00_01540, partial [Bacillota bacterium]|nr:hypothetical protein [Bacillota bacterium]